MPFRIDFTKTQMFSGASPEAIQVFKDHINGELQVNGMMS
jgi:hypothetical protein